MMSRSRPFSWRQTKLTNGPGTPPGGILVADWVAIGLVTCTGSNHPTRVYIYYPLTNRSAFPPHSSYVKCRFFLKNRTAPEMRRRSTSFASRFSLSPRQPSLIKIIFQQCIEPFLSVKLSFYVLKAIDPLHPNQSSTHFATSTHLQVERAHQN